jgi:hypothetical protein
MSNKRHEIFAKEIIEQARVHFKSQKEMNATRTNIEEVKEDPKIELDAHFNRIFSTLIGDDKNQKEKGGAASEHKGEIRPTPTEEKPAVLIKGEPSPITGMNGPDERSIFERLSPPHGENAFDGVSATTKPIEKLDNEKGAPSSDTKISVFERLSGRTAKD